MITYGSTTLTSYNTITKIEVYYYKSTSATSLSGGSWSTTKPTWENGKYIWQKIRTTYEGKLENGLYYSESDPVNITGQQGATGTAAYSYKLNASDTTVTVSKIGAYSVNKITFTATSKQGTGNVVPYAGRFKIETTINGTTWTISYTSSGNESSKEFTIPTGIIAIRCSLYQAGGTSTLLDIMTIPILSDDRPIVTKTYSGLIGSANDAANASFYFAKIHPDNYTTNYKVKMKVRVTAPEAYAETIDIQFGGYGSSFSSYDSYTTRTGSVGVYYINLYRATQAGISTNHKGHALGIGLRSSSNPTNTSYKRTIIIDILELDGCTIEMLDTAVKYANIDGTGSTNYYGLTEMAVGTTGQNATNNTNTNYTQYSNNVKAGTNGIKGYTLIMKDSENTWSCFYSGAYKKENTGKPVYTGGFMLGKILYSAGAGAQTSDSSLDTYYNYKSGVNTSTIYDAYPVDLRYSTNCASTLTSQRPVYIVGTIENDGLFHLDVSQWYTQAEPTYADGKVYVYVGIAYSTYQVWLSTENPAYMFYNGEFILYDKAQTLQNINILKNSLETQIDSKVETWCQKTNPANSWTAEERPNHTGDLWYYIGESGTTYKNNTTYQYNGETNVWSAYSANPDLFDKIDGKSTIYYGTTSSVTSAEEGDYLVDSENDCTYRWNNGAWVLATDYKQVAIDAIEIGGRNLLLNTTINANNLSKIRANSCFSFAVEDGIDCYKTTGNNTAHLFNGTDTWDCLSEKLKANTTYTYSAWIKTNKTKALGYSQYGHFNVSNSASTKSDKTHEDIAEKRIFKPEIVEEGQWTKISITFTTNDLDGSSFGIYPVYNTGTDTILYTYGMKLEKGNKVTDWTPAPEDVEQELSSLEENLQSQIDEKIQTFYQSTNPASSWTTTELRSPHDGDLWYYTGTTTSTYTKDNVYRYNASNNTWTVYSASGELFDKVDSKSTIFYGTTSGTYTGVETGDYLVDSTDGSSYRYDGSKWVKVTDYQGAIDAIEVGGRNLLYSTPKAYSATAYGAYDFELTEPLESAQTYTIQLWNIDVSHSAKTANQLGVNVYYCGGSVTFGGWIGTEYFINGHADHLSLTFTPTEANINHSDVTGATKKFIRIYNSVPSASGTLNMSIEKWQLERGNKATDWSFAPEDVDINNIDIGGRNLLYNSATMPAVSNGDKGWRASGGTVTHVELTSPPIHNVTGAIRVTNNDSTAKQIGMAQDKIKNKFIAGEKYTQSCWIRASENLQAYMTLIWISNSQTTGSSYVKTGGYYNITTDWTYIKIEGIELNGTQAASYSAGYVYGLNVPANGWFEVCGMKLEKGNKATDWTPAPEDTQADIDTALAQSVEYIIGTQTAATGNWTGVSSSLTELKDGTQIRYWLPYAGSGNATLNLTLKDGTSTGAIPIYRQGGSYNATSQVVVANRVTTHFPAGTSISMVYGVNRVVSAVSSSVTYTGTFTGWFADGAYDSGNTYNRTRMQNAITAATAITAGRIICGTSSGYKNIGANIAFDLSYPLLYASSAITATKTGDNNYLQINGISASNNGTITSGGANKTLYLKGTVLGNTFTISASPFMTTVVPTSADGFYYIPLGMMYSATAIYFISSNRLYAYIDGAFQPVDTAAVLRAQDAKDLATAVYGTCSTGATTVDKVVTCPNFTLFEGARIQITFTYANTAVASETTTNSPTLNVNGTGAKPIKIGIETANATNPLYWAAGAKIEFVYDGSAWILQNAPYTLYGTCDTEESVVSKQVACEGAVICKGTTIYVDMGYSNTAENATLNVANTVAKTIYANNATLTIRSRYNWNAGEKPSFTFDGQYWQMDKDTVPAYITDKDEDGIFVHPINNTASGWSIGKVFELLNNGYSYIKMWLEDVTDNLSAKIRIDREDQHRILLDKEIIQFKKGDTSEELASFSSSGISFDDGVPFKIGNDSTYVQFVDNNSDGVADALEIVADKISFKNGGNNTVQDIQERFNDLQTDISNITNNIEINPTADTPYVAITTQKNEYNAGLKLEPTQLSFQLNGQTTATIANDEMNIPTASVTNLFMQSANQSYEKIWVMRSNGHLSLKVGKQN